MWKPSGSITRLASTMTHRPLRIALIAWVILSALIASSVIGMYLWKGQPGLNVILVTGPLSRFWITFMSVIAAWLLGGLALWLLHSRHIDSKNALVWGGFFLVSFLYLNLLRERVQYGDLDSYILGATNLHNGEPFDSLYIYPPFWAMLLQPLVPLGEEAFLNVLWALNLLALMGFYWLLYTVLARYGFSRRAAALTVTLFMLANMPLLRTLYYMQVNLHVLNLIFVSMLAYPRSRLVSAFCLAVAAHLKASPLVLALAFLLERDWRWLAWLAFFGFFFFGVTLLSDGFQPYTSYLHNLSLLNQPHGMNFRETSFDSLFWTLSALLKFDGAWAQAGIYLSKAALGLATGLVLFRVVRSQAFHQGESANLLNALPPLMILMNMYSPLVWEHHGLFLMLSTCALLRLLSTPAEWTWFGLFYFVQYLIPTFDFFPWSYARMLTPLLLLWLIWRAGRREPGQPLPFTRLQYWLDSLPSPMVRP